MAIQVVMEISHRMELEKRGLSGRKRKVLTSVPRIILSLSFQYSRYSQPTDNTRNKSDIEETSVWRPFVVRESNTGYIDPQLGRRSVVSEEGTRLANFRHRPCISPPGRSVKIDRGYGDSARVG